jgi:hypothetical protein
VKVSTTMAPALSSSSPATAGPWTPGRVAGFGAVQFGALTAILGGWFTAAGQHSSSQVWPWLAVCLAGLSLSAAANGAAFFTARRAIAHRPLPTVRLTGRGPTRTVVDGRPVSGAGMTLFHRPDCMLVAGKNVVAVDRAELQACGMCRP